MKRKSIAMLVVAGLAGSTLLACGGGSSQQNSLEGQENQEQDSAMAEDNLKELGDATKITISVWNSGSGPIYEQIEEDFNTTHDDIQISIEMQQEDYNQYLGAKTAAQDLPDLFYVSTYSQISDFASRGQLVDLSDRDFVEKIYDQAKSSVSYDGKVYGWPESFEWWGILYNQDLFAQAGITEAPQTFSELETACEKLENAGITPFTAIYKDTWTLNQEFCAMLGSKLGSEEAIHEWIEAVNNGEGEFNVDGIDDIFKFFDLMKKYSGKNYIDADSTNGYYAFANQEAAMMFLSNAATIAVGTITTELPLGIFAPPLTENEEESIVSAGATNALVVNKDTKHLEEALEVLDWIADDQQSGWMNGINGCYGGTLPCMDYMPPEEVSSQQYYIDIKGYIDAGKYHSTIFPELLDGSQDVIGSTIQGYMADMLDKDATIEELNKSMKELAENQ